MKDRKLTRLMVTGIASGLFITSLSAQDKNKDDGYEKWKKHVESLDGNITYQEMNEENLLLQINEDSANLYNSLSPEGKALALQLASRSCNGMNQCKGLNACRSEKNACLGQGPCKGMTICAFSDKNLAVKVAAKKMAEKRAQL